MTKHNLVLNNNPASLLEIRNLTVKVFGTEKILVENFNLTLDENSLHVIIGGNGSGKTSLYRFLSNAPGYQVVTGGVFYKNFNLALLNKEQIADLGLIISFQYPVEIPGITTHQFLETALNSKFTTRYLGNISNSTNVEKINSKLVEKMRLIPEYLNRDLNTSFSGGERKRNELVQIFLLDKKIHLFDELDSGLDFDGISILEDIISYILINEEFQYLKDQISLNKKLKSNIIYPVRHSKLPNEKAIIAVTHSSLFMNSIFADFVHLMDKGQIQVTVDPMLAEHLLKKGAFTINKRPLNTNNSSKNVNQNYSIKKSNSSQYLLTGIIILNIISIYFLYNQINSIKLRPVQSTGVKDLVKAGSSLSNQEIAQLIEIYHKLVSKIPLSNSERKLLTRIGLQGELLEILKDLVFIFKIIFNHFKYIFKKFWDPFHHYD